MTYGSSCPAGMFGICTPNADGVPSCPTSECFECPVGTIPPEETLVGAEHWHDGDPAFAEVGSRWSWTLTATGWIPRNLQVHPGIFQGPPGILLDELTHSP